jgi:hypothetical protein
VTRRHRPPASRQASPCTGSLRPLIELSAAYGTHSLVFGADVGPVDPGCTLPPAPRSGAAVTSGIGPPVDNDRGGAEGSTACREPGADGGSSNGGKSAASTGGETASSRRLRDASSGRSVGGAAAAAAVGRATRRGSGSLGASSLTTRRSLATTLAASRPANTPSAASGAGGARLVTAGDGVFASRGGDGAVSFATTRGAGRGLASCAGGGAGFVSGGAVLAAGGGTEFATGGADGAVSFAATDGAG